MTQGDRVYLSVLEHKLSEIENNAREFRAILRHYLDEGRTQTIAGVEEAQQEISGASCCYAPTEETGDSC